MFLLSPSSYCITMRLLCQIAFGHGPFINTDSSCGISAPQSQDIKKQKGWGMGEDTDASAEAMTALLALTGPKCMSVSNQIPSAGTGRNKKFVCWGAERCDFHFWLDCRLPSCLGAALVVYSCSSLLIWMSFASCCSGCNIASGVVVILSGEALPSANRG